MPDAGGEDVEQQLRDQRGPADLGGPVARRARGVGARASSGRRTRRPARGSAGRGVHRDRRVEQRGRQAEVVDDGEARRLQGGLLLRVEQPGEQPPVEHLPAVRVGGPAVLHRDRVICAATVPARSRSTATASPAAASALATLGSVGPRAQSPVCTVTVLRLTVAWTASGCSGPRPASQRSSPMHAVGGGDQRGRERPGRPAAGRCRRRSVMAGEVNVTRRRPRPRRSPPGAPARRCAPGAVPAAAPAAAAASASCTRAVANGSAGSPGWRARRARPGRRPP